MPIRSAIPLILSLGLAALALPAWAEPRLEEINRYVWSESFGDFGGLSGIEVTDGGDGFLAISDRGTWLRARVMRDGDGISDVTVTARGPLLTTKGEPLDARNVDAEGIAIAPDGSIYVSYESNHRVTRLRDIAAAPDLLPRHRDFPNLQNNSSLEALAVDAAGTVYTIPERSGKLDRPFPVYRFRDGTWDKSLSVRREGRYLVSGADIGPDGKLYLLERDFTFLGGFTSRIRRFTLGPNGFDAGETLLTTSYGTYDNLEGISVWQDDRGRLRLTLISDDNYSVFQQTQIVEFVLNEAGS
ncbi:esterase-like activity of phytase family protein [Oceanomicrobium pacificus]|uniref:Esterase-like activity of phytase family protein n=1 Tax=Oceanomicrobium pacificus TaxID=2692916 RepID=A0A6B0TSU1_9RHOB|nr:esterase-like activity of phytase family protein [Oceanomicrobium pacificus]MXU64063.1 esterase-like activity of phytase family protein [Oceanomicrobium pacificus]